MPTGDSKLRALANSEDAENEIRFCSGIKTGDPSLNTMDHPWFIVSSTRRTNPLVHRVYLHYHQCRP